MDNNLQKEITLFSINLIEREGVVEVYAHFKGDGNKAFDLGVQIMAHLKRHQDVHVQPVFVLPAQ